MTVRGASSPVPGARPQKISPRDWVRPVDIVYVAVLAGALVVGMWVVHGGLGSLMTVEGVFSGSGQLSALLGTYLALVGVALMSRAPWIDHVVGSDRLARWHRLVAIGSIVLLSLHVVLTTTAWAIGSGNDVIAEFIGLNQTWDVLIASVGMALLLMVAVSSLRFVRRRLDYETWYGLHLYAYLGIALAFLHEVTMGSDLVGDPAALVMWIGLYAVAFGLMLRYRLLAPLVTTLRHRPRVAAVVRESGDTVSIYLHGRRFEKLDARSGQFFRLRFLRSGGWWRPHPFSLSAEPDGRLLRFTVKDLGDDSHRLQSIPRGTAVFLEGPYGAMTADRIERSRVVLFAGGIGVTPLRAILEGLAARGRRATFIYRVGATNEAIFRDELSAIAEAGGHDLHFVVGQRTHPAVADDRFGPAAIARLAPDVAEADVFVCGSPSFIDHVVGTLRALGVPRRRIHLERFGD